MKKLALLLVLCLLVSSIVPAFATEADELEQAPLAEVTNEQPAEPVVEEPVVEEPVVEEPVVEEPVVEEPVVEEPVVEEPVVEEPVVEEPVVEEPVVEEPVAEEPVVEEPVVEEPVVEEPVVEEPVVEEPVVEEPVVEEVKEEVPAEEPAPEEVPAEEPAPEEVPAEEVVEEEDLSLAAIEDFVTSGTTIIQYNGSSTSITLPTKDKDGNTLDRLSEACFANNKSILNVTVPDGIDLDSGCFRNCTSLLSFSNQNNSTFIPAETFEGCTSLQSCSWSTSLNWIQHDAFNGCVSLTGVPYSQNVSQIDDNAFAGCTSLTYVDFSDNLNWIGQGAFANCTALREIILPNSVMVVGNRAFENCSAATKLVLSTNAAFNIINNYTFSGCRSIKDITIPSNITEIGREAFYGCSGCGIFRLPKELVLVGNQAFAGRSSSSIIRWDDCQAAPPVYIGTDALGTSGYLLAPVGSAAHVYAKAHSGIKFITTLVRDFVLRCYNIILARNPGAPLSPANVEESGLLYWCKGVVDGSESGASLVRNFFESNEFINQKNSNTVKVQRLYDAMLDRNGAYTPAEIKFWQDYLDVGMTTDYIIDGFSTSNEFKALCVTYGMKPGSIALTRYRDRNYLATAFVSRLYTKVLERAFDENGLEYWTKRMLTKASTVAQVAEGFFFSNEYKAKYGNDNTVFLNKCYAAYFDRAADPVGWNYWMANIALGMKREKVLEGFASSVEFKNLKARYGLK